VPGPVRPHRAGECQVKRGNAIQVRAVALAAGVAVAACSASSTPGRGETSAGYNAAVSGVVNPSNWVSPRNVDTSP
jgi:hypothetical protein